MTDRGRIIKALIEANNFWYITSPQRTPTGYEVYVWTKEWKSYAFTEDGALIREG